MNNTSEIDLSGNNERREDTFHEDREKLLTLLSESEDLPREDNEISDLRLKIIQESYRRTPEFPTIEKLVARDPNGNETRITELIKAARKKVATDKVIFEKLIEVIVATTIRPLIETPEDYSAALKKRKIEYPETKDLFFKPSEPAETGRIMLYHWAPTESVPKILKEGLLPGVLSEFGSGKSILNYATLDLNNPWDSAIAAGNDEKTKFSLLQIDAGGMEILTWTFFETKAGEAEGRRGKELFSSKTLGADGERKMYHRMLRYDMAQMKNNPMPETLPRSEEFSEEWNYSFRLGGYIGPGFFNSSEDKEIMYWYAAPKRIKVIERKNVPELFRNQYRQAKDKSR